MESPVQVMVTAVQTSDLSSEPRDIEEASTPSVLRTAARIPRPGLSQSFRRMKTLLFRRTPTPEPRNKSPDSTDSSPERLIGNVLCYHRNFSKIKSVGVYN